MHAHTYAHMHARTRARLGSRAYAPQKNWDERRVLDLVVLGLLQVELFVGVLHIDVDLRVSAKDVPESSKQRVTSEDGGPLVIMVC
jgi:hypothetical protein